MECSLGGSGKKTGRVLVLGFEVVEAVKARFGSSLTILTVKILGRLL